jgi:SAM-dependent methyltransferase
LGAQTTLDNCSSGRLVCTEILDLAGLLAELEEYGISFGDETAYKMALEHERIHFVSFPSEWPPEMLYAAGVLTLELAEAYQAEGYGLKDATPYNILFRGTEPVFIDILSFERRNPCDQTWLAYAQFVRTFLLPLFVHSHFGLSLDKFFLSRRDGIEPEKVYRMASPVRRLLPPFLHLVSIPVWLGNKHNADDNSIYKPRLQNNPEKAAFILKALFSRLKRRLQRFQPSQKQTSTWSDYLDKNNNYSDKHFTEKCTFVESIIKAYSPKHVLDVGCNTGLFSAIAARNGAKVVAIDYDPVVVGEVWRKAQQEKLDILPLVVNLTRPTPAMGWRNAETSSFLDRASGTFDCVLMLAVIHHMLVTERIPLPEIISLASELTTDLLIIEFVAPEDSMFKRLTRGNGHLYGYLSKEVFEECCSNYFQIVDTQHIDETHRWLYALRKKPGVRGTV